MMQLENLAKQSENMLNNANFGKEGQSNQASNSSFSALNSQPQLPFRIIFRRPRSLVTVLCNPEDKVSSIIDKYRKKSGDKDPTKKFLFNAKCLHLQTRPFLI